MSCPAMCFSPVCPKFVRQLRQINKILWIPLTFDRICSNINSAPFRGKIRCLPGEMRSGGWFWLRGGCAIAELAAGCAGDPGSFGDPATWQLVIQGFRNPAILG